MKLTKKEIRDIAREMAEELRFLPDGMEITSAQLLERFCYRTEEWLEEDLFRYHEELIKAARAKHIMLDMSKHDHSFEGLPWNFEFIVRNEKAQIKCPLCGSRNTARILYGMPAMDDWLQKQIDAGRIHIGGCCISTAESADGEQICTGPKYFCNDCKKSFARPPYLVNKKTGRAEAYDDIVKEIKFLTGGFFLGHTEIRIKRNNAGAIVYTDKDPGGIFLIPEQQITEKRWKKILDRMYSEFYVQEWPEHFYDPYLVVCDGEQWSLEITLTNGRKQSCDGSNAYPPYWKEMKALYWRFLKWDAFTG